MQRDVLHLRGLLCTTCAEPSNWTSSQACLSFCGKTASLPSRAHRYPRTDHAPARAMAHEAVISTGPGSCPPARASGVTQHLRAQLCPRRLRHCHLTWFPLRQKRFNVVAYDCGGRTAFSRVLRPNGCGSRLYRGLHLLRDALAYNGRHLLLQRPWRQSRFLRRRPLAAF